MAVEGIPNAVQWHEGMLLTPQHFQQHALRQEGLLQYFVRGLNPYFWGVRRLAFDRELLLSGTLRILELEAILPDGLLVSYPEPGIPELGLDLTALPPPPPGQPMNIHLAVAAQGEHAYRGALARYLSVDGEPVADQNTGDGAVAIPRLTPHLRLLATDTPPAKYVSIPLARLQVRDGAFSLADYVPPLLAVARESKLGELCGSTAQRIREKALYLAEQVQAPSAGRSSHTEDNRERIRNMVASLPAFDALLSTDLASPFTLYLAFCNFAGQVAGMGLSLVPPQFSRYNHADALASFQEVQEFILRMLAEGISENYLRIPLQWDGQQFFCEMQPDWLKRKLFLSFRAPSGSEDRELVTWGEQCLIGTAGVMSSIRSTRVLGAPRKAVQRAEDLLAPRGTVLFSLTADPDFIRPGENLQVFNTEGGQGTRPAEIVLYVRKSHA